MPHDKPLTQKQAEGFAANWIAAWNSRDLDKILSHYADDFEFSSPFVIHIAREPTGRLRGKPAVRAYWTQALARRPKLHFTTTSVLWGVRSVVINYSREDGHTASEWFELGADGKVARSAAHYAD